MITPYNERPHAQTLYMLPYSRAATLRTPTALESVLSNVSAVAGNIEKCVDEAANATYDAALRAGSNVMQTLISYVPGGFYLLANKHALVARRRAERATKKAQKKQQMKKPSGESDYAQRQKGGHFWPEGSEPKRKKEEKPAWRGGMRYNW